MQAMKEDIIQVFANDSSNSCSNNTNIDEITTTTDESAEYMNKNQLKNTEFKVLCLSINLEVIKQQGFHPKFTVIFVFCSFLLILLIEILVYGYGTNWNLYVFAPIMIQKTLVAVDWFSRLGKTKQDTEKLNKNIFLIVVQILIGIAGLGGSLNAVIISIPFNDPAIFLACVYPVQFLQMIGMTIIFGKTETPPWLPQYRQPIYPILTKKSHKFTQKNNVIDEFQIYKTLVWVAFVVSTMLIDVFSDIYYGVDLILVYHDESLILMVIGIVILICCFGDLILVTAIMRFPNWVSYSSHLIAFIMEIPNAVLTVFSFWKIYQLGQLTNENKILWELAIFSFITTSLNGLIHIMYIIDRWTVHNAILRLQQM